MYSGDFSNVNVTNRYHNYSANKYIFLSSYFPSKYPKGKKSI